VKAKRDSTAEGSDVARKLKSDKVLFITALLLVCTSIVMVYSASAVSGLKEENVGAALRDGGVQDTYHFVTRQAMFAVVGLAALAVAMRVDYRAYRNEKFIYGVLGAVGVMLVAVLFTTSINGAQRWLSLGGLSLQPSEFAKIACVLLTALVLERRMHRINEPRYALLPIAIIVGGILTLIVKQPDYGTAAALLLIVVVMVFAAGLSYRYLAGAVILALPLLYILLMSADYRVRRIMAFLDPEADPLGAGYQAAQSIVAVGSGGIFGRGLNEGLQKMFYLPEAHNDFLFAVIGEELGLIGASCVLICFAVIAWRGLRIALRSEEAFGAFVALGLTAMICVQALINMSVVLSLLPTKGIPLPLLSAGGSSLLASLIGIGVLLNISQHATAEA
jgi:cell division protein FtsW